MNELIKGCLGSWEDGRTERYMGDNEKVESTVNR